MKGPLGLRYPWLPLYFVIGIILFPKIVFSMGDDLGKRTTLFKVDRIEVRGTKKVEHEAILEKVDIRPGMALDNYLLKKDIQSIYSMNFFSNVEAIQAKSKGQNILIFQVKEKPIIRSIEIDGNDELDEDDLIEQMKLKEYAILDINTVQNDVKSLQKFYEEKGFYLASVDFEIQKINEENVKVIYKIKEFDKVRVKKILFLGNRAFSDSELKAIMETREDSMFSWMTNSGNFKEFNFQTDIERLKFFYKSKGYLQIFVGNPQITISEDKKWIYITVKVNEGPEFTVNNISFNGELLFPVDELQTDLDSKEGDTYSEQKIRQDIQKLTEKYQDEGYAFANVLRTLRPIPGENKVDVNFSFEKGKIVYFGKITVKGNTKTRDKVIRRELKILEGMKYSGSKLRQSRENVNRLGFFEPNSVILNTVTPQGKDDVLDVEINIKERNTGQITLGAGYSTATKAFVQASIRQNNFRGLGQTLSLTLNLSDTIQTYTIGFTEPYLFDTKWTAGGDIYSTNDTRTESFRSKRRGFDFRVGYPIFDYTRLFLSYKLEYTEVQANDPTIDEDIEKGLASGIEKSIVHDKRNNTFEPTKGHYERFAVEYVGLGSEKKWMKLDADARFYHRVAGDLVFRARMNAGKLVKTDDRPIPRSEKFFLGGARNMRGYDFDSIGPLKTVPVTFTDNDNTSRTELRTFNNRGLFRFLTTFELEHPLVREAGLKWVVFADAGNVFPSLIGRGGDYTLRYDWGFGFRWFSPIGVLRFEFGYPINKRDNEASSQFHFDIGQLF